MKEYAVISLKKEEVRILGRILEMTYAYNKIELMNYAEKRNHKGLQEKITEMVIIRGLLKELEL